MKLVTGKSYGTTASVLGMSSGEPLAIVQRRVLRLFVLIRVLDASSAAVIWGVGTLFLLHVGLDLFEVFAVNAIATACSVLFEIPAGVLTDARGRRFSFLLSMALLLAATLGNIAMAQLGATLWLASLFAAFNGIAYAFLSGSMESWLVDALWATEFSGSMERIFARGSIVSSAAMLPASVAGGALSNFDPSWPFVARALLLVAVILVAVPFMHDLGFTRREVPASRLPLEMWRLARTSICFSRQNHSVGLVLAASAIQSVFHAWGFQAWQPYFVQLMGKEDGRVTGVIAALLSVMNIAGNWSVHFFVRRCGRRTSVMLIATAAQAIAVVGLALAPSFFLALLCFLASAAGSGLYAPMKQIYLHRSIVSELRATIISFESLVSRGGNMIGQVGLGALAQAQSLAASYLVGGLVIGMAIPVLWLLRRKNDPNDCIMQARPGFQSG